MMTRACAESTEYLLRSLGYSTAHLDPAKAFLNFDRLSEVWCLISDSDAGHERLRTSIALDCKWLQNFR